MEWWLRRRRELPDVARRLGLRLAAQGIGSGTVEAEDALSRLDLDALDLVQRFYALLPGDGYCLRIALVAGHLLRYREPEVAISVKRTDSGEIRAHAWLMIGGHAIDPLAGEYSPLSS